MQWKLPCPPQKGMDKWWDALLLWGIQQGTECHTQHLGSSYQADNFILLFCLPFPLVASVQTMPCWLSEC